MAFIAKNPLSAAKLETAPPSPIEGARGLFAKEDGWYDIDDNGDVRKIATGDVTLEKSDVGLNNVDNTADLDKPISTATLAALENKADISNVLTKNNTSVFTPTGDYNPATKKYVDDKIASEIGAALEGDY